MKKILLSVLSLLISGGLVGLSAQEKEMKTGWSFGVLPCATYSVDNGLQYGAFGDVYYYGDGWEASHFTKGRTRLYLAYDSKYLIPNMRVNASATFVDDPLYNFWGFNGPASLTDNTLWANKETGINYYGMSRKMFRALANVQGRIVDHLNWAAGVNYWNWKLGDMNERYGYDLNNTLYREYQKIGAISAAEAAGGQVLEMNAGFVFDTRDIEAAPNRGIWAEAYVNGSPDVFGKFADPYVKVCAYFRHYISIPIHIKAGDPVFAYRLAYQGTVFGETPFCMIQNVPLLVQRNMISEGFGSGNTIRGIRENRILTEGFAWANTELRVKLFNFKLLNQFFYIAVNPFFDCGVITKTYRSDILSKAAGTIYDASKEGDIISSAGAGLKIAMNQNFIISVELAHTFYNALNADPWIGIGINYQF